MTGLTRSFYAPLMRVGVTIGARVARHRPVQRDFFSAGIRLQRQRVRGVTIGAGDIDMFAREGIPRFRMIKRWRRRPGFGVMTLMAAALQFPAVNVIGFVTTCARRIQTNPWRAGPALG
jgi:hypothetical protein